MSSLEESPIIYIFQMSYIIFFLNILYAQLMFKIYKYI